MKTAKCRNGRGNCAQQWRRGEMRNDVGNNSRAAGTATDPDRTYKPDPGGEAEKADHGPSVPQGTEKSMVHRWRIARN